MTDSGRRIFNMVIALLISIAAWVFVVYNYDPMNLVRYTDVQVQFTGEEELAARGLAVSEASTETVTVTLSQRRVDGSVISASDITVTADVSECVAGPNSVILKVSGPDGTSVSSMSPTAIEVNVSRIRSEIRDIDVIYGEGAEEDAEPMAFDLSQESAEISCTAENIGKVSKVAAVLDPEEVTDSVKSYTVKLAALDSSGNVIPHVVIDPKEISLDARAGVKKTVPLDVPITDNSDDDYERRYSAPSTVTIKGPESLINKITSVTADEIDISYIYSDADLEIDYDLPEEVVLANESSDQIVRVRVSEKETEEE